MSLDVVVPALRTATIDRLLASLAQGTVRPDAVSLVSNEVPDGLETYGLQVRLLRFRSDRYPIGDRDLALRRDVGIWCSECSHVLTLDDDLVAPANLVETSLELLDRDGAQQLDPARRQQPVGRVAVHREVERPGRAGQPHLPADMWGAEVRQPWF